MMTGTSTPAARSPAARPTGAVDVGHRHVEDDDLGQVGPRLGGQRGQRGAAAAGLLDGVAAELERAAELRANSASPRLSTTMTRQGASPPPAGRRFSPAITATSLAGSTTEKQLPRPRSLSTSTAPPWAAMMPRHAARPRPCPVSFVEKNGSKVRGPRGQPRVHPDARVAHLDEHPIARSDRRAQGRVPAPVELLDAARAHADLAGLVAERVRRVRQQVHDDLIDRRALADDDEVPGPMSSSRRAFFDSVASSNEPSSRTTAPMSTGSRRPRSRWPA